MLAFLTPNPPRILGDGTSSGLTAGNGREGAGDAERRSDGEDPKEERRLCDTGGGSIGRFEVIGVPGVDGADEVIVAELLVAWVRLVRSAGAGLLDDIRLAGRSIFMNFPWVVSVN